MSEIGRRIKELRKSLGLSQAMLAEQTGIPLRTLKGYEAGNRVPGGDALTSFASIGANVNRLLVGTGPFTVERGIESAPPNDALPEGNYVAIPLFNVRAAAGAGALVYDESVVDALCFKQEWIHHELRAAPQDLRLIHVDGESMEPMLHAGDVILVNIADQTARRDGIYVLRLDDALLVKRLQRLPDHRIRVTSDNPAYQPFELKLPLEDNGAAIIGRVVWVGKRI